MNKGSITVYGLSINNSRLYVGIMFILYAVLVSQVQATSTRPFNIEENLFKREQPVSLGLNYAKSLSHNTVFTAQKEVAQYNHGAVLFSFKNRLFAQWQSSKKDEDGADTRVLYSVSDNGIDWSDPKALATSNNQALITNGGWWSDGNTLVSYFNVWPYKANAAAKGGYVTYKTSENGIQWSSAKRLRMKNNQYVQGIIEQDIKKTTNNHLLTALHTDPGLIAKPFYTTDPLGITDWVIAEMPNLPYSKNTSREIEPSWFNTSDQQTVMIFRDQASSFRVLASKSTDQGKTWSLPQETNMPDARAKLSAGNLPDGSAYIVNCPSGSKQRMPLVLTLSEDGKVFDQALLLRTQSAADELKFPGKYKRLGFSYPKSIIWKDALWVSYAHNKEDIMVTKVPLATL